MIPGINPFKKPPSQVNTPTAESANALERSGPSETDSQPQRNAPSSKLAPPPAPLRRASAKKTSTLSVTSVSGGPVILEENEGSGAAAYKQDEFDEADRNELDNLERQSQGNSPQGTRRSSDSQRAALAPATRPRRPSSTNHHPSIGAPQINGASTPRPFGEDLPTPEIISRDLSSPACGEDKRRPSIGGGVTSSGLVDPNQSLPSVQDPHVNTKARRRPSSTGPILCALGCGTMGRSILSGVLDAIEESGITMHRSGLLPPARFIACVRREAAATKLKEEWGDMVSVVRGPEGNARAVSESDYILLGSKPQVAREILTSPGMRESLHGKVLISILAGTTIGTLQSLCPPDTKVVRVMPNTPSRIRKGMSVIVPGEGVAGTELELVSWIFNQVGKTLVMDEKHIDAATAMCGSGPAFMAVILESMTDGGVMMGIPRQQAEELAAQTMLGTASMVQAGQHPALIRNAVATPGGCTIGGLLEMEDGRIRSTMARTIQTATNIAAGLGKN
ncbi:Pyrroline-5-carboxylate reductase [Taphrina deformans PYCC 5710]|uniref:Pyrroline-5-carboxylate reductase n=1 Tax=Taphrina deformans (strain PYCC 5710 / ATCC 11124 / CBS 356.35 / IMI 108563 / JCM 9778 / NBRC 8474) TaxID=1097556 RepID=R4X6Q5_TAPDE|nr:Pyrroline-5-carboxylate reductase [Taphrina deformans PYCC 5710]|eukprot:CCG80872.1 Pyrroline-5-carboxylate reductase [Taphrina deformans PYCC 5710]